MSSQQQQQPKASTSSPGSTTPRLTTTSPSRLELARQTALGQSSTSAVGDRHTQAVVKAGLNRTTAGGRSLDRQIILEETDYASSLDRIIKRDFFPELARLDATNEYLAAVEAMDADRLERSVRTLWDIEGETGETPRFPGGRQSDTPVPFDRPHRRHKPIPSSASTLARASHLPTLDRFQARHTSEDNASFTSILASENDARKRKMAWAYEQEPVVRRRVEEAEGKWRRLLQDAPRSQEERTRRVEAARASERLRISGPMPSDGGPGSNRSNGKGKAREIEPSPAAATDASLSAVAVVSDNDADSTTLVRTTTTTDGLSPRPPLSPPLSPTDLPLAPSSHLALALRAAGLPQTRTDDVAVAAHADRAAVRATRTKEETTSATVEAWPWKTRNSLMFSPDVDVSPHDPPRPVSSSADILAGPPRAIKHDATRLPDDFAFSVADRRAAAASAGASSVGGESPTRSEVAAAIAGTTYDRPLSSATPRPYVGSYPLVAPLPSPTPASLGPARIAQLLTWGTLLSTPRALEGTGVGGWTIRAPSRRDQLGRKLASQTNSNAKPSSSTTSSLSSAARGNTAKRRRFDTLSLDGRGRGGLMLPPSLSSPSSLTPSHGRKSLSTLSPAARGLSERIKAASGSLTPRPSFPSSSSSSTAGGNGQAAGRNGGRQRGEAMERTAAWTGIKAKGTTVDLGRRRWSESPSPRLPRTND